jgi:hypothetical protein
MHSQSWRTFRHVARFAPETSSNLSCPHAFSRADPTSAYPGHYPRPLLLGASLPPGHTAWPPAPIAERAVGGLLRSVRPFSVTLGRHYTPCPSYRVDTTYLATTWPNGDISLLGLPVPAVTGVSRLAGSNSRRLRAFVENPDRSHLLEASPLSASSLSPFTPCTPTFEGQSPAVG